MIRTGNTFEGSNGRFTGVYYRRNREWFPGVLDRQTNKRTYGIAVRSAWDAATVSAQMAESAAGEDAEMIIKESLK